MGSLKGKNAFITGTSQGIGAAIADQLIDAGCNLCIHYFSSDEVPKQLETKAEGLGQKVLCLKADLTDEADTVRCVQEAVKSFGTFDVLINNSGALVERRGVTEITEDYWRRLIDINLSTMMYVTRELVPHLNKKEGASIVNMASLAGRKGGHAGSLVYSTTKGAMLTWTRSLSGELGADGIRVNSVSPGFIEGTRFHKTHTKKESAIQTIEGIPLGRSGNPDDVARAVVFLASEYDGFITGATLDINGGVYCA
ncbi:MAG: SDR family oxidoreductase [Cyclobacteriaceae bacterium]